MSKYQLFSRFRPFFLTNWVFHTTYSADLFCFCLWMILVPGKGPSFDILPHKRDTSMRQGKKWVKWKCCQWGFLSLSLYSLVPSPQSVAYASWKLASAENSSPPILASPQKMRCAFFSENACATYNTQHIFSQNKASLLNS